MDNDEILKRIKNSIGPKTLERFIRENELSLSQNKITTDVVVMFVDIRRYTELAETCTPAQLVEVLNAFLTLTGLCIDKNGGTIDKFMGDCTMAVWGLHGPVEDAEYKACKAAIDMINRSKLFSDYLMEKCGREVTFGIGIHAGPAIVGNIGSDAYMTYTAVGDTVNIAERLEDIAPAGTAYVSCEMAKRLGDRAELLSGGAKLLLKGKKKRIKIFKLISLK